ncbi:DMT family transporter [Psychrobacter sp. AOP3-A1-26]|uniref:DMT family transporter n=1 Tax=Psychrobacter sp. AOP3-A1-26 TaxID=3457700 RepID=UPI004036E06D
MLATSFYYYGFVVGTLLLPTSIAGLLSGSIPMFTLLGAALFLPEERPTKQMALGFAGIVLTARPWQGDTGLSLTGVLWMLAGSLSIGASFVYTRRFLSRLKLPPLALATWQTGIAVITLSVLIDFEGITNLATNSQALWGTVFGLGMLGTGTAFLIYYYIIETLGSVRAAVATYIALFVAVVIGAIIGENITSLEVVALLLIIGGVLLIQTSRIRQSNPI